MSEERHVLICCRTIDLGLPEIESSIKKCKECKSPVWVANSSPTDVEYLCTHCMARKVQEGKEDYKLMPPSDKQLNEIIEWRKRKLKA